MSRKNRKRGRPIGDNRRFSVRSELRRKPDVQKIARAVVALAIAQAEAEAEQQAKAAKGATEQPQNGDTPDA